MKVYERNEDKEQASNVRILGTPRPKIKITGTKGTA